MLLCPFVQKTASELSFTPLQSILFAEVTLDVTNCSEVHQVEKVLSERLEKLSASCPQLIDLTLTSRDQKSSNGIRAAAVRNRFYRQ